MALAGTITCNNKMYLMKHAWPCLATNLLKIWSRCPTTDGNVVR